jgi:hypothetical protein
MSSIWTRRKGNSRTLPSARGEVVRARIVRRRSRERGIDALHRRSYRFDTMRVIGP